MRVSTHVVQFHRSPRELALSLGDVPGQLRMHPSGRRLYAGERQSWDEARSISACASRGRGAAINAPTATACASAASNSCAVLMMLRTTARPSSSRCGPTPTGSSTIRPASWKSPPPSSRPACSHEHGRAATGVEWGRHCACAAERHEVYLRSAGSWAYLSRPRARLGGSSGVFFCRLAGRENPWRRTLSPLLGKPSV